MDDGCCAVCAEPLEWVAYGPCGHRDVCATCISRLRFVCNDRRCCICKSHSNSVFVTKALGSFTRIINDFSILPADARDGKVGSYWFHEGTEAYFDDFDEYKIIKAMCRVSCSFCDKLEAEGIKKSNRRAKFKSIEQLKDHLSRQHELFFCSLCLENKKVFICEQKLYTRVQLRQHIRDGDVDVDGDESERCGFSGHPLCEYCQTPFYGDNELYLHMSTEHYTCHICQRQNPSGYEYYKDYDELENHFRHTHFLCEDDSCLEKKFIVFANEADMKRHNALEHGGHMSRSKRNAALQLPACFRYREREEEARRRIRAHVSGRGVSDHQLASATSASAERTRSDSPNDASSILQAVPGHSTTGEAGSTSYPALPSSGQAQRTVVDFRGVLLSGVAFPPLPRTSKRRRRKSKKNSEETNANTALTLSSTPSSAINGSSMAPPAVNHTPSSSAGLVSRSNPAVLFQSRTVATGHSRPSSSSASSANSLRNTGSKDVSTSSSAPDVVDRRSIGPSTRGEPAAKGDEGSQTVNKSLVEGIRAALEFDKGKFDAFKVISKEYREGEIDAGEYLAYVQQFGLAHLVLDLASLCPDPQKRKDLIEIHKMSLGDVKENGQRRESDKKSANTVSKKGKEICEDTGSSSKGEALPDSIAKQLKELQLKTKPHKQEPSSSKGVDHPTKGKARAQAIVEPPPIPFTESRGGDAGHSNGSGSNNSTGTTATGSKKKPKKQPKFLKARLGESSVTAVSDLNCSDLASDPRVGRPNQDSNYHSSVRGVWQNGGGRRLVAMTQAWPSTR